MTLPTLSPADPRAAIDAGARLVDIRGADEHARELLALVRPGAKTAVSCKFNLIPFNPFPASGLLRSPMERVMAFA